MTTVLVTGGAGGIGSAVARRVAADGASVVVADVDTDAGERVAAEVGGRFVRTDVGDLDDNRRAVETAVSGFGSLDAAVFAAAVPGRASLTDFDPAAYRDALRIDLDGVVHGLVACWEPLRASQGSALVVSSLAGLTGSPDVFYSAAKHALVGLVRGTAMAHPDGPRVNALCPGLVDTPLIDPMRETLLAAGLPISSTDDVAAAAIDVLHARATGEVWVLPAGGAAEVVPAPAVRL